jgi:hypothetical protein
VAPGGDANAHVLEGQVGHMIHHMTYIYTTSNDSLW